MTISTHPVVTNLSAALRVDAVASGGLGLLTAAGAVVLGPLLGLPVPLLVGAGLFLVAWAAGLLVLAATRTVPRAGGWAVVAVNSAWVVASVGVVLAAAPTVLGIVFLVAQALVVALFVKWQVVALRRTGAVPAMA